MTHSNSYTAPEHSDNGFSPSESPTLSHSSENEAVLSFGLQKIDFNETIEEEMIATELEQEDGRCHEPRQAEARYQRGYARRNAMVILMNDDKFHQIQQAIKQTGMLPGKGVKQVLLAPTNPDRSHAPRSI